VQLSAARIKEPFLREFKFISHTGIKPQHYSFTMPVTFEQAKAITQAITFDVWNNSSKPERIALMEKYCSPQVAAYAPDGSKTVGIEDVRFRSDSNSANYGLLSFLSWRIVH
jgi:hypothetical protein